MISVAKLVVLFFGIFLILVGFLMLSSPKKARGLLQKAGSTVLINYGEITLRLLVGLGFVLTAEVSKAPFFSQYFGWFLIVTSLVLFLVPMNLHHQFALKSAVILQPKIIRILSVLPIFFGFWLIFLF